MQFTLRHKIYKVIPKGGGFQPTAGPRVEHVGQHTSWSCDGPRHVLLVSTRDFGMTQ